MDEYVGLISNCDACIKKTTTSGCFTCEVYKLRVSIAEIQNEIIKLKKNNKKLCNYYVLINSKYYNMLIDIIDFGRINIYKRDLDYLLPEENIVAILCDKRRLSSNGNNDIFTTIN